MVELVSTTGARQMPVAEFIRGPRDTALAQGELLSAIIVPEIADTARSAFLKLGARRYLVISIAMVAVTCDVVRGALSNVHIAVGACSPVAQRLPTLERALEGQTFDAALEIVARADLSALRPIDDVRASAEYRRWMVEVMVRRAVISLLKEEN